MPLYMDMHSIDGGVAVKDVRQAHVADPIAPGAHRRRLVADFWQDLRYAGRMLARQPGCGEHQRHPIGEQPARRILAGDETRQGLQGTAVAIGQGTGLVKDFEVDGEQIVDAVVHAHVPGVLQGLAR